MANANANEIAVFFCFPLLNRSKMQKESEESIATEESKDTKEQSEKKVYNVKAPKKNQKTRCDCGADGVHYRSKCKWLLLLK